MIISKTNSKVYTISIAGREVQRQHTKGRGEATTFYEPNSALIYSG